MKVIEHREGRTRLAVPSASLEHDPPPTSPVFFNPAASLNRDVTVAVTTAAGGRTFCDSMAGVGARGIRVANEVEEVESVTLVDFNSEALNLARQSARLNRVLGKCEFSNSETSSYLFSRYGRERRFEFLDVDPFGSPVRQVPAALSATSDGGLLSVTATDTAVLCGVYREVCSRRYGSLPLNNEFRHETAIRTLVGYLARAAAQIDIGLEPILAHSTRHYVRAFVRVAVGSSRAERTVKELGQISYCPACGQVEHAKGLPGPCSRCGKRPKLAGPLWVGGLVEDGVAREASGVAAKLGLPRSAEVLASLVRVNSFPPWSFSIDEVCSSLKTPTVPEEGIYRRLVEVGHRVMRTPFEKTGLKTDASREEVVAAARAEAANAASRSKSVAR